MTFLAIYNGTNKRFRRDGDEFRREALTWSDTQPEPVRVVDVRDGRIRREIRKVDGLKVLAIFDHGTPRGLPRLRESHKGVKGLARTIANVTVKITIILYSCSCGRGRWWWWPKNKKNKTVRWSEYDARDGYAIALCAALKKRGVAARVFAHLTAGHTTRNPHVVRVGATYPSGKSGMISRDRWVNLGTPKWQRWRSEMRGPLRFTFWQEGGFGG